MPVDPSFEEGLDIVFWVRKNLQRSSNNFLCFLDEEINLWDVDEQWKALKIVDLALQCAQVEASTRPAMRDVVSCSKPEQFQILKLGRYTSGISCKQRLLTAGQWPGIGISDQESTITVLGELIRIQ
ncbi:hypothetical protein HAX54_032476 [Datura stramonium]|uniref:Uncharacterized protein n=1 Tax=Datura stramonium TaxID=4076 RepID=A0ABS8VBR0_DATST|nr:hypothetical protein [Datura stramonium]